jgi:hypothetical protein
MTKRRKPADIPLNERRKTRKMRTEKPCNCCKAVKLLSEFHGNSYSADGKTNTCKPCGNARSNKYIKANRATVNKQCEKVPARAYRLWKAAKGRAAKEGVAFSLSRAWVEDQMRGNCAVTGLAFNLEISGHRARKPHSPSIDRVIPGGAYSEENCRMVVTIYNLARSNFSDEDVLELARALLGLTKSKSASKYTVSSHRAMH